MIDTKTNNNLNIMNILLQYSINILHIVLKAKFYYIILNIEVLIYN